MISCNFQELSSKIGKVVDRMIIDGSEFYIYKRNPNNNYSFEEVYPEELSVSDLYYCMISIKDLPCTWSFLPDAKKTMEVVKTKCFDYRKCVEEEIHQPIEEGILMSLNSII